MDFKSERPFHPLPDTTGAIEIQLNKPPPQGWEPPIHIKVEHGKGSADLLKLKQKVEALIREKLLFRADVELVAPNNLPKFEYKAKLVRKLYQEIS